MNYETPALFLEKLAIMGGICTYAELAKRFGMAVPNPSQWRQSELGIFIASITDEDVKLGRPLRSAVLVRAKQETPGRGFFTIYNRVRAENLCTHDELMDAWTKERRRAATYPWWTASGLSVEGL